MVSHVTTVAFRGIEAMPVDVQVQIAPGLPHFAVVGLPDKAVGEAPIGFARRFTPAVWRCHRSGLSSISPPPICRKRAVITISRSRLA